MALLEVEKWLLQKLDLFDELKAGAHPARSAGATR